MTLPLSNIQRKSLDAVLGKIGSQDPHESERAGLALCSEAKSFGLDLRSYLTLAVDVRQSHKEVNGQKYNPYQTGEGRFMSGYEAALMELNLPIKQDLKSGIVLEAASDTFNFKPGTRALFPEVIDDMMRWEDRQDQFETTDGLVAQSRTIRGTELITRAIMKDSEEVRQTSIVAEFGNIPVFDLQSTENAVKFYKFGSAMRTSYEFQRRVSLDILTPYAARIERQMQIGKVAMATNMLINGDSVHGAATAHALSTYGGDFTGGKTLKNNYPALMKFLVKCAQQGTPVDTLVGNLDMYVELFLMFTPVTGNTSVAEHLQSKGAPSVGLTLPLMKNVNFRLSSAMPAGKLMAYSKADTLEELIEANSDIKESETAIKNQSITYVRTQNAGYKLIFGDTRRVLDCTA